MPKSKLRIVLHTSQGDMSLKRRHSEEEPPAWSMGRALGQGLAGGRTTEQKRLPLSGILQCLVQRLTPESLTRLYSTF